MIKKSYKYILLALTLTIFMNFMNANLINADPVEKSKVIYLTFDDGPSYITTDKILQILKDKNVKATFFIVGSKIKGREEILKRIQDGGHCIGLHSYTHVISKIYSNENTFIKEMDDTREEIKRVLGIDATAIRFPTGSKPHLNQKFLDDLHAHNYKVFDWNASLPDGINCNIKADKLFQYATKVVAKSSKVFLLLHCDQCNKNTSEALPKIIDYYKENGYEFKTIDDNTDEFYFRFKK